MAITTVIKRLLGVEDVNWDSDGSDSRFPVETSTGGTRSVKRVNSSDIPSTTAAREKKRIGTGTPTTGGKNVDGHLQELYDDLNKIGEPDADTIQNLDGVLQVKQIDSAEIVTDAVTTAKIKDLNVLREKIALKAVDTAQIEDDAVTSAKIEDAAVTPDAIASNAVETAKIPDENITAAKLNLSTGVLKQPKFFCVAAGFIVPATGDDLQEFAVDGVLRTDILVGNVASSSTNDGYYVMDFRVKTDEDGKIEWHGYSIATGMHPMKVSYVIYRAVST